MRRLVPLALAGVLLAGCSDAFTPSGVSGAYTLRSVNGNALPFVETDGGTTITLNSGAITLLEAGTYTQSASVTVAEGTSTLTLTFSESGTFTLVEPSTIRFTDEEGDVTSGTLDGGRLTFTEDGDTYVFEK